MTEFKEQAPKCSKHGTKGEPACLECHRVLTELFTKANVNVILP